MSTHVVPDKLVQLGEVRCWSTTDQHVTVELKVEDRSFRIEHLPEPTAIALYSVLTDLVSWGQGPDDD